jgi:hypothetical protein
MNQPPPAEVTAMPLAVWLGAALVAAFVLIAVLALIDREARPRLEAARDLGPVARSHPTP